MTGSRPWSMHLLVAVVIACLAGGSVAPCRGAPEAAPAEPEAEPQDGPADPQADGESRGRIPPVPDGTPQEILRFIARISDPAALPRSRGRRRYYLKRAGATFVEAADKILAQVAADDPLHAEAVRLKLDGLALLEEMGDDRVPATTAAFARSLVDHPDPAIARQARRMALASDVDALYAARSAAGADELVAAAATLLAAAPDDDATARVAAQLATDLASLPGAEAVAKQAHEKFVPLLAASRDARVRAQGEKLAKALRRLALVGRPLAVEGRLIDGTPFDPRILAGKVVLVDFWATWCGPCVAEIPTIRAQYDKYHAAGFEVVGVSIDDDRAAVADFVATKEIPWPVILDGRGPGHSLADRYDIRAIPALFLVGRDGNVISLQARGKALEDLLAEQFPAVR
jgi:thiol-disulfide isomerase/thioredoxin